MHRKEDFTISAEMTMKEYRKIHNEKRKEWFTPENKRRFRESFIKLIDVIIQPRFVGMKDFKGTEEELEREIEDFYTNDGRAFNPIFTYPPSMIDNYGKDYALNTRGIYYFREFRSDLVTLDRKVWVPSFKNIDWEDPGEWDRRRRAKIIVEHNINNETRHKSEYAWEADAWADIFSEMRNDPCLEVDKHDYLTKLPITHEILCTLTGKSKLVTRIPDATFGLATFSEATKDPSVRVDELDRERLERLLLHPKCGLLADPKWGETDLIFPFAVYEAKGWSGDCREARRQACQGAACYLDMLDNLARTPGPVGSTKIYQTTKSHQYQVFALTSFGAHWHLLVGYRRPRQEHEYAGTPGLSDTVYIFQRVWSSRITNERSAWELLSLIDQIHLWAITEFRTFVTDHLKPWHKFCDDNYLLDWKSVYDVKPELKEDRLFHEEKDLSLPSWVSLLNKPMQKRIQERAQESLRAAIAEYCRQNGGYKGTFRLGCSLDPCSGSEAYGPEAYLEHARVVHKMSIKELLNIASALEDIVEVYDRDQELKKDDTAKNGRHDDGKDAPGIEKKRRFDEDESFDGGVLNPSFENIPSPSKRRKVA